VKELWKSVNI